MTKKERAEYARLCSHLQAESQTDGTMNINETMKELAQYLRMQEEIAETVEGLKDQIKAYMKENGLETLASDEHKATYKAVSSSRIDTTAFKKAFPSMAEQFTKTTTSTRFTFN